jgi:UDP-N-acetylglucosamine 1-carboxyvinyltransferase
MDYKEIHPVSQVSGSVAISGAKNSALLILAAVVLLDKPVLLNRIPDISDVRKMCDILNMLNIKVRWMGHDALLIDPSEVRFNDLMAEVCGEIRTSVLFLGVLLGKFGQAKLRMPGGCQLGPRPINFHISAMERMGAKTTQEGVHVSGTLIAPHQASVVSFKRSTVTGTANAILCAVSLPHPVLIQGAALEPELDDLINFLVQAGARIKREGQDIRVEGGQPLETQSYRVMPDRIEAGTFLIAGAILGGEVTVADIIPQHLLAVVEALKQSGADIEVGEQSVSLKMSRPPKPVSITAREYPHFPTDLQPQWCVLSLVSEGESTIEDHVFPERFDHMDELKKIGARYTKSAHGVTIQGGVQLLGGEMYAANLRSAAALVLGALSARSPSKVVRISVLNRGYPGFFLKINNILSD